MLHFFNSLIFLFSNQLSLFAGDGIRVTGLLQFLNQQALNQSLLYLRSGSNYILFCQAFVLNYFYSSLETGEMRYLV